MDRKANEFHKDLGDAYKDLPLKMRVKVNMTAGELLELQKKNSSVITDAGDRSLDGGKEDGEKFITKEGLL